MKKLILCLLTGLAFNQATAQCGTPVSSVSETFSLGSTPLCWTASGYVTYASGQMALSSSGGTSSLIILPMTDNCRGTLSFDAARVWNYEISSVQVGVVSSPANLASWTLLTTVGTNYTMSTYNVDLSGYTGNYQYLVLRLQSMSAGNPARKCTIDNVNYTAGCMSSSVTVQTQDISLQLNYQGQASIGPEEVDNGSSGTCGNITMSIDKNSFSCADIGVQQVELTVTDNNGNTNSAFANVTVLPAINDEALTPVSTSACLGSDVNISTASSVSGINYYLRDDATDAIIDGPIVGTGGSISFVTNSISSDASFNVYAETPAAPVPTYSLDFDGTNDVINTNILIPPTSTLTIEAMVYPRSVSYDRILSNYLGSSSVLAGDLVIDTYDPTYNNGRGVRFLVCGPGNVVYSLSLPNILTLNTWNHIAASFDNGVVKIYHNGVLAGTGNAPFTSYVGATRNLFIGEDAGGTTAEFFNGKLDEIRIWTVARTQSEIDVNKAACLDGSELNLIGHFPFEEGTGTSTQNMITATSSTLTNMDAADWVAGSYACEYVVDSQCSFEMTDKVTITVADVAPVPDVASLQQIDSACEVTSLVAPTATDDCSGVITGTHDAVLPITSTTTVTWTYDDGNGNLSTQTQEVVIAPWDYSITDNFGTIEAATTGLASYQWVDCNNGNTPIPGAMGETFVPSINGSYALVTSDGSCEFTSNCVIYATAGISQNFSISALQLYPNPGKDQVNILNTKGLEQIVVRDMQGKEVLKSDSTVIEVYSLSPAIYMIEVTDANGTQVLRFTKQ